MDSILEIKEITKVFGGLTAVDAVTMSVQYGEIRALIGPNGSGKTTLLNSISGIYQPEKGEVVFKGQSLLDRTPHFIAEQGLNRTFQNLRLFNNLSVLKNVMIGNYTKGQAHLLQAIINGAHTKKEEQKTKEKALECLEFVGLEVDIFTKAADLPYGQRKLLEIARTLAAEPDMILLDEPAAGMNPQEKQRLVHLIRRIRDKGITVLIVEHDMTVVMSISDRISVLNFGKKIAEGSPEEIQNNDQVIEAYLGRVV